MLTTQKQSHAIGNGWTPDTWRSRTALHQPVYLCPTDHRVALQTLALRPALVEADKVLQLKALIARAQEGQGFILQGGDCAESFDQCSRETATRQVKVLQQMAQILMQRLQTPVVCLARLAGQYAKPRSSDSETLGQQTLPVYRGDIVNASAFTAAKRQADPQRLLQAHTCSAATLGFVRALYESGVDELLKPAQWSTAWIDRLPEREAYLHTIQGVQHTSQFMAALAGNDTDRFVHRETYVSHEALLLDYEQALTRQVQGFDGWFNLCTHFPWIGKRTADLDGAHVEYCRGIRNPLGVKVGADVSPDALLALIDRLNPHNEPGRLTLIHRMGADHLRTQLPALLDAVRHSGAKVLWLCDPMHGNTETLRCGTKTRRFERILAEIEAAFSVHREQGTRLGGLHLELTGEDVTECLGGARDLRAEDLGRRYLSKVDPRLNYEQSLELALRVAHLDHPRH